MIPPDRYVIRHADGRLVGAVHGGFDMADYPLGGGRWTIENAEAMLRMLPAFNHDVSQLRIEHAPCCGCCGRWERSAIAVVAHLGDDPVIRCERHVGRNPCCIEGCGKTFAHQPDSGRGAENYSWTVMCGRHWRQGPKELRDRVATLRKRGRRFGWNAHLEQRHSELWEEVRAAVAGGYSGDLEAEVNKAMGWD